jgi:adenylosuccinate synthase
MKEIQEAIDRLDQLRIDITKVENDDKVEREAYEIQQLLFKAMDVVKKLTIQRVVEQSEQLFCDCSQGKGTDIDEDGFPYCIECQKNIAS